MIKKKILWMTNVRFTTSNIKVTGTWLQPLAESINNVEGFEIYHIVTGNEQIVTKENVKGIEQYVLPNRKKRYGTQIPNKQTCIEVKELIKVIDPDLIHVWGTESIWGYMKKSGAFGNRKALLDMQGFMRSCYESYYGGLKFSERIQCYGIKEFIKPSLSIYAQRRKFKKWASVEEEILKSFDFISYQSDWIKNRISEYSLKTEMFPTKIILRKDFYCSNWVPTLNSSPVLFTISSGSVSYKGIHILIKACNVIHKYYPCFKLKIAGNFMSSKFGMKNGYDIFLKKLISKYRLSENILFLGSLSSEEIIKEQLCSDVCVIPSFVESYCLGMAEAMAIGLPTVASYVAALPCIAMDKKEALFYNSLDYVDCAMKVIQLFENKELAIELSKNGKSRRMKDNDLLEVINTQIDIYKNILI